jgi:sirohydrochlorin cobaltochelatase
LKEAVVLFAHGSREPQWAQPFEALRAQAIRARHPGLELVLAPTIGEQAEVISALATLIARG